MATQMPNMKTVEGLEELQQILIQARQDAQIRVSHNVSGADQRAADQRLNEAAPVIETAIQQFMPEIFGAPASDVDGYGMRNVNAEGVKDGKISFKEDDYLGPLLADVQGAIDNFDQYLKRTQDAPAAKPDTRAKAEESSLSDISPDEVVTFSTKSSTPVGAEHQIASLINGENIQNNSEALREIETKINALLDAGYKPTSQDTLSVFSMQNLVQQYGSAESVGISSSIGLSVGNMPLAMKGDTPVGAERPEVQANMTGLAPKVPHVEVEVLPDITPSVTEDTSMSFPRADEDWHQERDKLNALEEQFKTTLTPEQQELYSPLYFDPASNFPPGTMLGLRIDYAEQMEIAEGINTKVAEFERSLSPEQMEQWTEYKQAHEEFYGAPNTLEISDAPTPVLTSPDQGVERIQPAAGFEGRPVIVGIGLENVPYDPQVAEMQKALKFAGTEYHEMLKYTGRDGTERDVDGIEGIRTREAVEMYAEKNGLDINKMSIEEFTDHVKDNSWQYSQDRANGFAQGAAKLPDDHLNGSYSGAAEQKPIDLTQGLSQGVKQDADVEATQEIVREKLPHEMQSSYNM